MEITGKIQGLESAMKAMRAAFPDNPQKQRQLLNQTMSFAARRSIIPVAKQLALQGDGSGALSEAIQPRAVSLSRARAAGKSATIQITPVRSNKKAMALYVNFHYARVGKAVPSNIFVSGISHGHLVEFGTKNTSARPFLWPAVVSQRGAYMSLFAKTLKKKVQTAVKLMAKKAAKAKR